jgi:hypothetical protein
MSFLGHHKDMTQFLTSRQVATALGVTISHVNRLASSGKLASVAQIAGYKGSRLYDAAVVETLKTERAA